MYGIDQPPDGPSAEDLAETPVRHVDHRRVELRVIEGIEGLEPELHTHRAR